jgi:hypothetical protein
LKKLLHVLLTFALAASLHAQTPVAAPDYVTTYSPEQLDQLVSPIALYPDALVAIILPAATAPSDIVLAARYLAANGDPTQIANQSWDDSVKALANYPEVIQWMSDNLDWTSALGRAYLQQPTQVMESIQQMRAQARANGALVDTPQQVYLLDGSNILIQPVASDAICVPEYDPNLVFADDGVAYTGPVIYFGPPCPVGPWLNYECDWDDYGIWVGVWHPGWAYTRDWRNHQTGDRGGFWRANNVHQGELLRTINRPVGAPPQARPMAKAPAVAQRSVAGFRPTATSTPARPDPTGWRADGNQRVTAPPREAPETGPKIITAPSVVSSPQSRAPDLNEIRPQEVAPTESARPEAKASASVAAAPAPRAQIAPSPGPAFGDYSRGTTAQDYSNRGQASRAAASPPPQAPPRSMPEAPRSEPAPAPRMEQAPESAPGPGNPLNRH